MAGSLRSARGSPPGQRELSPVRWCGSGDAGVYLGRSGWVQVQQRSLDEQQRTTRSHGLSKLPPRDCRELCDIRVRLADCHSASEPGRRRPDSLALPHGQRPIVHTPSPVLPSYDPISPPPITPIISPPPAFQDLEPPRQKPPHLSRSAVAVDADSPPHSPITRFRRHRTPSPQTTSHNSKHRNSSSCASFVGRRTRNVSASSSEDEGPWKAAVPRRRASPRARSSDSSSSAGDGDTWGGRVRRSRSLQLPEERPPPAHRPRRHLSSKWILTVYFPGYSRSLSNEIQQGRGGQTAAVDVQTTKVSVQVGILYYLP